MVEQLTRTQLVRIISHLHNEKTMIGINRDYLKGTLPSTYNLNNITPPSNLSSLNIDEYKKQFINETPPPTSDYLYNISILATLSSLTIDEYRAHLDKLNREAFVKRDQQYKDYFKTYYPNVSFDDLRPFASETYNYHQYGHIKNKKKYIYNANDNTWTDEEWHPRCRCKNGCHHTKQKSCIIC